MFSSTAKTVLEGSKKILFVGCGGGYDIYTGLPVYFNYQDKSVLANVTFSEMEKLTRLGSEKISFNRKEGLVWKVDAEKDDGSHVGDKYPENYIPEYLLSKNLKRPVYAIHPSGVQSLKCVFEYIVSKEGVDAVVLVDGGIDSLMFGDEEDIGSFSEDMGTMLAVSLLDKSIRKILVANTWGVERVSHCRFFENVAQLVRQNGFLGAQFLEKDSPQAQFYLEVIRRCAPENSSINISLMAALEGQDWKTVHPLALKRYDDALPLGQFSLQSWIGCPLSAFYWFFDLEAVVRNVKYRDVLWETNDIADVDHAVHKWRWRQNLVSEEGEFVGERKNVVQ